jgi:hypothetical protein
MAVMKGRSDVGQISQRDLFMLGLALYWGEGYKQGSQELGFTNSNAEIIRLYIHWLRQIYGVEKARLILRVSINVSHKHRVQEVTQFWSRIAGVPLSQFTKPSLIQSKSKKVYTNHHEHFGTLRVKVRNGTSLRRQILASIDALRI